MALPFCFLLACTQLCSHFSQWPWLLLVVCSFQSEAFLNTADEAVDCLQNRIDTRHHYVPSFYITAVENAGGEHTLSSQVTMLTQFEGTPAVGLLHLGLPSQSYP